MDIIFLSHNSLQQHRNIPLHFLDELDHPISLLFSNDICSYDCLLHW